MARAVAVAVAAVSVSLGVAACDSSPIAASVNSHQIKQTALQRELRAWTSSPQYVTQFNQNNQSQGVMVEGTAPGSYSSGFTAYVLARMVVASAVHQYLVARHRPAPPDAVAAARGVYEAELGRAWPSFPSWFRDRQVTEYAEQASFEPPSDVAVNSSELQQAFQANQAYFFSRVCTRQITVSVAGSDGSVDRRASRNKAEQVRTQFNLSHSVGGAGGASGQQGSAATGSVGGAVVCYTPAQLEQRPLRFFQAVFALAPGQAGQPVATPDGFTVLAVDSRTFQAFTPAVAQVLALTLQRGSDPAGLIDVLDRARVTIDNAFGTWSHKQLTVVPPSRPSEVIAAVGSSNLGVVGAPLAGGPAAGSPAG